MVAGGEGVVQIKDGMLVFGKTDEHDVRLRKVLSKFREAGLTLEKRNVNSVSRRLKGSVWCELSRVDSSFAGSN